MSSYEQVQKTIREITEQLYPAIDVLFYKINLLKNKTQQSETLAEAFDIFELLQEEINSLKKYELKLVFPGVNRFFAEMDVAIPQHIRINELHDLLKRKEECIKDKVLELEVEAGDDENLFTELVSLFKENYFCKKDAFYRYLAKLQKERAVKCSNENILEPDSLAI